MKRKYGAARSRETLSEQRMREAAKAAGDNSHNYGSSLTQGLADTRQEAQPVVNWQSESWQSGRMRRS